ncbi:hypothetical protein DNH61_23850 [Paenibacillus sambharensis]|uniref:Methyltransferase n=1 Tax=Paenibacillus sambharensis TaxID=1803190 RepID=A0A2W1L6B3_9BACL|nr:hypothetical protein [Paenibacillus sambharensis]PZD93650.1 hypothetical protein DNH61_23850 [Paenibacillus sambharensis]
MSRSWERKVRRNSTVINRQRKKSGAQSIAGAVQRVDRFKGRNFILPVFLLLFTGGYAYLATIPAAAPEGENVTSTGMFWLTIGCYFLLAMLFFFRRPYLSVAKDYVGTRRMTGDKTLYASSIKSISVQPGYVVIEQVKGANWVFSKAINRFPTEAMAERLRAFAKENNITFHEKAAK